MKVQAQWNTRKGFCFNIEDVPEEILKTSYSHREVKEKFLKYKGLCIMDIKNFVLSFPPEMQDEEDS